MIFISPGCYILTSYLKLTIKINYNTFFYKVKLFLSYFQIFKKILESLVFFA